MAPALLASWVCAVFSSLKQFDWLARDVAMHLFIAALSTETNTFAPMPTGFAGFEEYFYHRRNGTDLPPTLMTEALHKWRAGAEALGWRVTDSVSAIAEPAGLTPLAVYEGLRADILADLEVAAPDVILLQLHGAMVAEGYEDVEADLVAHCRRLCPKAFIGVALDLHCHLNAPLIEAADAVVTMKEYPHDDVGERGQELFDLAVRSLKSGVRPAMALAETDMIYLYLTKTGPMAEFVQRMKDAEAEPGVLSVSLAHCFPWADLEEVGARVLVVTEGDQALAERWAQTLAEEFYDMREDLRQDYPDLKTALDRVEAATALPVTMADMSDNSGAGAPGDSTFVLAEVLRRGMEDVALGMIWDPMAVAACEAVGEGATIRLHVGGKSEPASGDPLDIEAEIKAIRSGLIQHLGEGDEPLGTQVWLRLAGRVDVVINNLRTQVYHPEAFTQLGIDLSPKRLIVPKSLFHFYSPFAAISKEVIFCATPGRVNPDTALIPFTKRDGNYWPRVQDPRAAK